MRENTGTRPLQVKPSFYMFFFLLILSYIFVALNAEKFPSSNLILNLIYLMPVSILFSVSFRSLSKNRDLTNMFLPLSFILFSVSEFLWAYYDLKSDSLSQAIPVWTEAIYLMGYLFAIRYLHIKLSDLISFKANLRQDILDSTIIGFLLTSFVLHYIISGSNSFLEESSIAERIISFSYLFMDITIIITTLVYMLVIQGFRNRSPESLMVAAFFIMAVADCIYMILQWSVGYATGKGLGLFSDILWISAYSLLAIAISHWSNFKRVNFDHLYIDLRGETFKNRITTALPFFTVASILFYGFQAFKVQNNFPLFLNYVVFVLILLVLSGIKLTMLTVENIALFTKSVTDPLTGTYNHRFFHDQLRKEIERARRNDSNLAIAVLDLDNFSDVNDSLGHSAGDQLLKKIVYVFKQNLRKTDYLCRIGGDEFGIILPDTSAVEAEIIVKRIANKVTNLLRAKFFIVTFSAGIAAFPSDAVQKDELVKKADEALYWAKYRGKNQVVTSFQMMNSSIKNMKSEAKDRSYIETVMALAAAVDAKDEYTRFHSQRTAILVREFAKRLKLDENTIELLEMAALVHDVGKIGVAESILQKKGPLTAEERQIINNHPILGSKILTKTSMSRIIPWIAHHHERWDGKGYPNGLKGEMIPLEARILAICDAYEAMRSDRPYRPALTREEAKKEILENAGKQFDPYLARTFVEMLEETDIF